MDEKAATAIADLLAPGSSPNGSQAGAARPCFLILVRGGTPGAMVRLVDGCNRLGRGADSTWQFTEPSVSRQHALIHANVDVAWLTDLDSTNGTYLNGRRLSGQVPTPLRDGDRLQLGTSVMVKFVRPDACEERFHREMFERTVRDPLTGLYNRAYFLEHAPDLATQLTGRGIGLALLMLDVDHFKRINDGYGHDAGDAVLREVAAVLRQMMRPDDLVARYGGEEFAAALPVSRPEQALERAERLRAALEARRVRVGGQAVLRVTASLGLAYAAAGEIRPITSMVTEADRCLYEAKRSGRNRVVASVDPPPTAADFPSVGPTPVERRI